MKLPGKFVEVNKEDAEISGACNKNGKCVGPLPHTPRWKRDLRHGNIVTEIRMAFREAGCLLGIRFSSYPHYVHRRREGSNSNNAR
jgi:hypothetical protein